MSRKIYPEGKNPFAGKKVAVFKQKFIYPNDGKIRFQVELDKNGQIYDIHQSFAQIIKDPETKKRFVKTIIKERPRALYDHIKGRPFQMATPWIDLYVDSFQETSELAL